VGLEGSNSKRSILVLRLSIYLQIIQIKAHSLEVSKERNAALTTGMLLKSVIEKHVSLLQQGINYGSI
jgi:hypothetical protein